MVKLDLMRTLNPTLDFSSMEFFTKERKKRNEKIFRFVSSDTLYSFNGVGSLYKVLI